MQRIRLRKAAWTYDPSVPLGPPGGFGAVFLGHDEEGKEVAIKKLHASSTSAGNRELDISEELEGKTFPHIIPFFDSGIDAETMDYFVVLAKAECSLQQLLDKGSISEIDAVRILTDIAQGLFEAEEIVHRDLKPGNVLYHENRWKLADFGIARFVEESTSLNTLKDCLSPFYAAPEQWRFERATKATDVYAFGCISFALLTGHPPFISGDLRQRHLNEDPPRITASPGMQQLLSLCLRKSQKVRPSVDSILMQLRGISANNSPPHSALAAAGATIAAEEAKKEAAILLKRSEEQERRELAKDAVRSLDDIIEMMFDTIKANAPVAKRIQQKGGVSWEGIELGSGKLRIELPFPFLHKEDFLRSKKDIVVGALILLDQEAAHYLGRSANLWFGKFSGDEYRWWEIPYIDLYRKTFDRDPFGFSSLQDLRLADFAASTGVHHSILHAAPPKLIDGEYTEKFIERWVTRLADASVKKLQRPRSLPES